MAKRPLNIAMISYYLPSGSKIGVGYWVDQLAREMCRRGHAVTIFSGCEPVVGAPYDVRQIELSGRGRTFQFALRVRELDLAEFDVLHAHGDDYWLWRKRVNRHIRTLHGSCFSEAIHIKGFKERIRMLALGVSEVLASVVADETAVISPATRKWTPWVRRVIPDGPDLSRFEPKIDGAGRSEVPSVLFVGTYQRRKRGWLVVDQFRRIVQPAMPNAELWMVSEDSPTFPGVKSLGRVTDEELTQLYRSAWVFCLPSTYEGLGIPYLEAMAAGVPVVATPNPGSSFVLANGQYGNLVSDEEIGTTLVDLLNDPQRRLAYGDLGRQRVTQMDLTAAADAYEELYAEPSGRA